MADLVRTQSTSNRSGSSSHLNHDGDALPNAARLIILFEAKCEIPVARGNYVVLQISLIHPRVKRGGLAVNMNPQKSGEITSNQKNAGVQRTPTIDAIHRDIAIANQYRIELIKILLTIAAALFAFTVTFRPSLTRIDFGWAMWVGWFGLGSSMIGGLFHMLGWDHYYKSYRDHDWKNPDPDAGKRDGKEARKKINCWRRGGMIFQFGGFVVGVIGIGLFAGANIDNARKPEQEAALVSPQQHEPAKQQHQQPANIAPPAR